MTSYPSAAIPSSQLTSYEQDYCLWLSQNLENLQAKQFQDIDFTLVKSFYFEEM